MLSVFFILRNILIIFTIIGLILAGVGILMTLIQPPHKIKKWTKVFIIGAIMFVACFMTSVIATSIYHKSQIEENA